MWRSTTFKPRADQMYLPKMKAGIFHGLINNEMVFHYDVKFCHVVEYAIFQVV